MALTYDLSFSKSDEIVILILVPEIRFLFSFTNINSLELVDRKDFVEQNLKNVLHKKYFST